MDAHLGKRARVQLIAVRTPNLKPQGTWPSPYCWKRYLTMSSDSYIDVPALTHNAYTLTRSRRYLVCTKDVCPYASAPIELWRFVQSKRHRGARKEGEGRGEGEGLHV